MVERNMCNAVMRGNAVPPGSKSTSRAKGSRRKLGYPTSGRRLRVRSRVRRSASGRRGAVADDARAWEVGRGHSSCEAGEQGRAICCGVGGAKGRGQGECAPSKHAPDTVPGSACHTRWPHAYIVSLMVRLDPRWEPYEGKPRVPDLCGGREVTRVPTATGRNEKSGDQNLFPTIMPSHQRSLAHVFTGAIDPTILSTRSRVFFAAGFCFSIHGADLAPAAGQVHCNSGTRQRCGFRHPPPW